MATAAPAGPLALSMEDLPGPAFILDGPDGRVGSHNLAFAGWAGQRDPTGIPLTELLPGDTGAARLWSEACSTGAAEHYVERRGRDGEGSLWSLRARRIPAGVLVCAVDLSALAAAAHAVHAAERDYVAVAAHELRAPLSAIKAWASALDGRRGAMGPAESDGLGAISRQVDRMNELLTDLFDAARAGAGALGAERAPVAVDALVRGAVLASPHAARVALRGSLSGQVLVDAAQIEAVIGRLIGWIAARQPSGAIGLGVERRGGEVHVVVDDGGPPLSRRDEEEIFARAIRSRRGRGLGLYLCQQMAAANGARVFRERAASPPGACFVLALPEVPAARGPAAPRGPARVLVGEPDPVRRARTLAALRLEGYEADGAPDGARLFAILDEGTWDVVVIDVLLPGVFHTGREPLSPAAGLAALERIRACASPPAVVVIAPSAERPEVLDGMERAGVLAVLARPVDWPHLVSLVGGVAAARAETSHWSAPETV